MKSIIVAALAGAISAIQVEADAEAGMFPFMMDSHMSAVYRPSLSQHHMSPSPFGQYPVG